MNFAIGLGFHNIIAETDSLNVATAMTTSIQAPSYFGSVIHDCRVLVTHVKGEVNMLANKLAKNALDFPKRSAIWLEEIHKKNGRIQLKEVATNHRGP